MPLSQHVTTGPSSNPPIQAIATLQSTWLLLALSILFTYSSTLHYWQLVFGYRKNLFLNTIYLLLKLCTGIYCYCSISSFIYLFYHNIICRSLTSGGPGMSLLQPSRTQWWQKTRSRSRTLLEVWICRRSGLLGWRVGSTVTLKLRTCQRLTSRDPCPWGTSLCHLQPWRPCSLRSQWQCCRKGLEECLN